MEVNNQGHNLADLNLWLSACLLTGSLGAGIPEFWRMIWLLGGGLAFLLMGSLKLVKAYRGRRTDDLKQKMLEQRVMRLQRATRNDSSRSGRLLA